ncbi:MAG: DUF885 domain-containing protein [Clostridiales bacterium]|nr:DUF885 domain-containing protein [Clostridiales bacterium]
MNYLHRKHTYLCILRSLATILLSCLLALTACGSAGSGSVIDSTVGAESHTDSTSDSAASDSSVSSETPADERFITYIDALFCEEVSASALSLHYTLKYPENYGITSYNTDLGTYTAQNIEISAALAENIRIAVSEFDANSLSTENRLTRDVLLDSLESAITAASFPYYEEPLRPSTGVQSELPLLLAEYTFQSRQDISDYLEILAGIPAYFDSICAYEKEKYERGLFMSDFTAETLIAQCEDFAASAKDNYLIYTFEEKVAGMSDLTVNEQSAFCRQNQAIVTQQVLPAFQKIADTLRELSSDDYSSAKDIETGTASLSANGFVAGAASLSANGMYGLCSFPMGREYYAFLVRQATGSSDQIEALQERINSRRTLDLLEIAALLEGNPSPETEALSAEAPCETPEEMLELLEEAIRADFPSVESCSYTIKYVDASMENYLSPAFYLTSPLDDYTQNSIYINSGNGYEGIRLFATLAHEGYPGHLYQNAWFYSTNPSPIRALLGPSGYLEGWATYVELFSYRYAGLSENAARLLALEQSAILSLYATADLGIHADGWSFTDTLDFFSDYGFTDKDTVREIFELIVAEPAHYLKYYVGYLELTDLKEYAKEIRSTAYSDLAFHRAVLTMGPAPFSILKEYLPDYLNGTSE